MPIHYSARNQLKGTVKSMKLGEIMAEVVVDLPGGQQITSAITRTSVESLHLQMGDEIVVMIKSTEVMIGKDM